MDEHHVHVYASKSNDETIVRTPHPADIFSNSIATSSLVAAIITGKYANHLPLDRQSHCYRDNGVNLETNTLANWMIRAFELHFPIMYDELHKYLYDCKVVHADETPFEVIRDGRKAGSKSLMWVYHTREYDDKCHPVVIYDFQNTRKTDHPQQFLKDYSGVLVTDGYQVYHTLEKKRDVLLVAECRIHAKRSFAEYVKATGTDGLDRTVAAQAANLIPEIFHLDHQCGDCYSRRT